MKEPILIDFLEKVVTAKRAFYCQLLRQNSTYWLSDPRIYIYIYILFFIIERLKARAIPCPHQPPSKGDNTVSVAQGGTATPGVTKQLFPTDRVLRELYISIYMYIYTPDQLRAETTLDVNLHFQCAVCDLKYIYIYLYISVCMCVCMGEVPNYEFHILHVKWMYFQSASL